MDGSWRGHSIMGGRLRRGINCMSGSVWSMRHYEKMKPMKHGWE